MNLIGPGGGTRALLLVELLQDGGRCVTVERARVGEGGRVIIEEEEVTVKPLILLFQKCVQ